MLNARTKIQAKIKQLEAINVDVLFVEVVRDNADIQNLILDLNRFNQLFDKGIDSEGQDLGEYTPFTIQIKTGKGQPVDRVTLKDTGAFYDSFGIVFGADFVEITANFIKDGDDLRDDWGENITGLTNESITLLQGAILQGVQEATRKRFFR